MRAELQRERSAVAIRSDDLRHAGGLRMSPTIERGSRNLMDSNYILTRLRRQWLWVVAIYGVLLAIGAAFIVNAALPGAAGRWLALAAAMMCGQMAILWVSLHHNRSSSAAASLRPTLGIANAMTLGRGLLVCCLTGFLVVAQPLGALVWAPAILYTVERVVDFCDGWVARSTRGETGLGAILDMEFDGIGILIAVGLAIQAGKLPVWYLVLGLARPLFVVGLWLRRYWQQPVLDLSPSDHRRLIAGFQTGFVSVVLWPILTPQITLLASYLFAIPLILSFGRDWLVVSTTIDANAGSYQRARGRAKWLLEGWLPLVARVVGALLALLLLWRGLPLLRSGLSLAGIGAISPSVTIVVAALWFVALLALLTGVLGRAAALVLIGCACLDILATGLHWSTNALLLTCAIIVVHVGSGNFALWQPEERLLRARLGAPAEAA